MPSGSNRQTPSAAAASAFAARFNGALAIALPQGRAAECGSRSACRCPSRLQLRVPGAARCSTPRGRGAGACTSSWRSRRLSLQAALWCAPRVHVDAASSNSREFRWRDGKLFSRTGLRSVRENNFHRNIDQVSHSRVLPVGCETKGVRGRPATQAALHDGGLHSSKYRMSIPRCNKAQPERC